MINRASVRNLTPGSPVRALVIDDSATIRTFLVEILQRTEGIQVIGTGASGEDAVRLTRRMKPDVLLMDIHLPEMDGLEATRHIMREQPTPIVLISGSLDRPDVDLSFAALNAGALTVMSKPEMTDREACEQLVETLRSMARVPVVRRWGRDNTLTPILPITAPPRPETARNPATLTEEELKHCRIIGIAASTGGPASLLRLFKTLPGTFPLPILVVQHVTNGFGAGFAEWLDHEVVALSVRLATHGEIPQPGAILIAPDDHHLQLNRREQVELIKGPAYHGLRPSANYLFHALAQIYRNRALGIILTGMGDDGVNGLGALHQAGGLTIAQDEASCVVYGMPKEAVRRNAVTAVLSIDEIAETLQRLR